MISLLTSDLAAALAPSKLANAPRRLETSFAAAARFTGPSASGAAIAIHPTACSWTISMVWSAWGSPLAAASAAPISR